MSSIKKEIRKSLYNIYFILPCFLGIVLSMIYSFKAIDMYSEYCKHVRFDEVLTQNTLAPTFNAYMIWIGGPRLETDKTSVIFFWYIILVAALPYAWSYCAERRIAKKHTKSFKSDFKHKLSQYISVFISSGLIAAIPLFLNLVITLLFIPATKPDPIYNIYYREFSSSLLGDIYYSNTMIYECCYILLFFVFCGLIGCIGYSFSLIIKKEAVAVAAPAILLLMIHFIKRKIYHTYINISPFEYMNVADRMFRDYKIMFIEMLIMLVTSFLCMLIINAKEKHNLSKINKTSI